MNVSEFGFKNLCSYGNKLQKIKIGDKGELILILGENGAGKTTISNALTFAAYGKTTKRSIASLPNRINGGTEMYMKFKTDTGVPVEVARGIKPNSFDLKVDGQPENKSSKPKLDAYIENELIGIAFDVFANTILLSINDFKSFIRITAENKRKIIDKIFSTDILNKMNALLKEDLKAAREKLAQVETAITSQDAILTRTEEQLAELRVNLSETIIKRKNELKTSQNKLTINAATFKEQISQYETDIKANEDKATELKNQLIAKLTEIDEWSKSEKLRLNSNNTEKETKLEADKKKHTDDLEVDKRTAIQLASDKLIKSQTKIETEKIEAINVVTSKIKEAENKLDAKFETTKEGIINIAKAEIAKIHEEETADKEKRDAGMQKLNDEEAENTKLNKADTLTLTDITLQISKFNDKIELHAKGKCPICESDLTTQDNKAILEQTKKDLKKLNTKSINLNKVIAKRTNRNVKIKELLGDHVQDMLSTDFMYRINVVKTKATKDGEIASVGITTEKKKLSEELSLKEKDFERVYQKALTDLNLVYNNILQDLNQKYLDDCEKATAQINIDLTALRGRMTINIEIVDEGVEKQKQDANSKTDLMLTNLSNANKKLVEDKHTTLMEEQTNSAELTKISDELFTLDTTETDGSIETTEKLIKSINEELDVWKDTRNEHETSIQLCLETQELLTEHGIKQIVFEKALPILNNTIEKITSALNYKYPFYFTNDFEPVILEHGQEIDVNSLSTGEDTLIDLIVILSMIELIKMKHPKMNMLFLDEIFSSLSRTNIIKVVDILKQYVQKYNMTIFVISHTPVPMEQFDKMIEVEFKDNFSNLEIK